MDTKVKYSQFIKQIPTHVNLIAVSKTKSQDEILELYKEGQRDFGENYVQELIDKYTNLPKDIRWHFIGHLQSNKVKYIAEFVHLIHSVDSIKLLKEIDKQGEKYQRKISCLLQSYVGNEETKFGLDKNEILSIIQSSEIKEMNNIVISGLMGMASNVEDESQIKNEFSQLKDLFEECKKSVIHQVKIEILSMGMSSDFTLAIESGSTMIRVGSLLFGQRNYKN